MKPLLLVAVALTACTEKAPVALKPPDLAHGASEYQTRCALCHGKAGAGDGAMAGALAVKPRNLADPMWQASITDAALDEVILKGGKAVGKSELMPGNFEHDRQSLADVRAFLRALPHGQRAK